MRRLQRCPLLRPALAAGALLLSLAAAGEERILEYASDILIAADGRVTVTETITVLAEGVDIRRGIYRDWPTRYRDRFGNDVRVVYAPRSLARNGRPEPFRTERRGNGVRAWFGSPERLLEPGVHTYAWRYEANRVLGFFDERDELYWNVTGLGWAFPIERASATVRFAFELPEGALDVDGATGPAGARGRAFTASTQGGRAHFETTAPLSPGEGLTIAVSWPKGHVPEPGAWQRAAWLLADNRNLLVALLGLALLLAYSLWAWNRYGRDPAPGPVVPRYEPPAGYSPASLRYVSRMAYDNRTLTAAILNLAVKGYLRIEEAGGTHSLARRAPPAAAPPLAAGERALLDVLFRAGDRIALSEDNHETLGLARRRHRRSLARDYANRYFRTNGLLSLPAVVIAVVAAALALGMRPGPTPAAIVVIGAMAAAIVVFALLMRRPTARGRSLLDEVAGFREYLEIAEKDELNLRNPPQRTPQLFERYLPFALAMGVEQAWAERFSGVLAGLRGPRDTPYHPAWYGGTWDAARPFSAASGVANGLGAAISASVSPPGSSSGSGGGGFSGGGGGGGGGGGW